MQTSEKHITCFFEFYFFLSKILFVFPWEKTLLETQDLSINGFFLGKHHPVPAVHPITIIHHYFLNGQHDICNHISYCKINFILVYFVAGCALTIVNYGMKLFNHAD